MTRQWRVLGHSVLGASHERTGSPNQDARKATLLEAGKGYVIAVADGHGDALHARSDSGSKFAVEIAVQILSDWIEREADATEDHVRDSASDLPRQLLTGWRRAVAADLKSNPPSLENGAPLQGGSNSNSVDGEILYGSTLLAAAAGARFSIYLQLGDGDIVTIGRENSPERPVSGRTDLPVTQTESLCQPDAVRRFRHQVKFFTDGERPNLVLLATDGYANSFADDSEFLKIGSDLKQYLEGHGADWVSDQLGGWLKETTEHGSGDDITLALAWSPASALTVSEERAPPRQELLLPSQESAPPPRERAPPPREPAPRSREPAPRREEPAPRPRRLRAAAAILPILLVSLAWLASRLVPATTPETTTLRAASPVNSVAFSPEGLLIAAATDGGAAVWDIRAGQWQPLDGAGSGRTDTVAISPDLTLVVVGCGSWVCLCSTGTGEIIRKQEVGQEVGSVSSATFSPDGAMIGFSTGATAWLWRWEHNAPQPLYGDSGPIRAVAFAENGRRFVTAGSDAKIWDISDGAVLSLARAHVGRVNALAVSPEGKRVASAGEDRSVKIWSAEDGHLLGELDAPIARISAMAFSPGGGDVALAGGNTLAIYNLAGGNVIKASGNTGPLQSTVFATGGRVLAASAKDKAITIWDLDRSKLLAAPTVPRS